MSVPTVAPTGEQGLALSYLWTMIAASATFQTWTDSADATEALERIWVTEAPSDVQDPDHADFQSVFVVLFAGQTQHQHIATGDRYQYDSQQPLQAVFFVQTPEAYRSPAEAGNLLIWLDNQLHAVVAEIMAQSGEAGKLAFTTLTREPVERSAQQELAGAGDWLVVEMSFTYDGDPA